MAITCPRCGAGFDVTLFEFGRRVQCDCGAWVDLARGHMLSPQVQTKEGVEMAEQEIGRVTHYFGKAQVAAIELTKGSLAVGDRIHVKGHTSDFTQPVNSMQIERESIQTATIGQTVGIRVVEHVREHDAVYRVVD